MGISLNRRRAFQTISKSHTRDQPHSPTFYCLLTVRNVEPEIKGHIKQSPLKKPEQKVNLAYDFGKEAPAWAHCEALRGQWRLTSPSPHSDARFLLQDNLMRVVC